MVSFFAINTYSKMHSSDTETLSTWLNVQKNINTVSPIALFPSSLVHGEKEIRSALVADS